jgi:predicted secreted protein
VRRAAGHDQRTGVMGRIFAITAVVCALIFALWFLVLHGPGAGLAGPGQNKV